MNFWPMLLTHAIGTKALFDTAVISKINSLQLAVKLSVDVVTRTTVAEHESSMTLLFHKKLTLKF